MTAAQTATQTAIQSATQPSPTRAKTTSNASRSSAASAPAPDYHMALGRALRGLTALPSESVPLAQALGRTLRAPLRTDRPLPPFDRATMDGFALRIDEVRVGATVPVVARIAAGERHRGAIPRGSCAAIATGAPVPPGLDTVVEFERTTEGRDARAVTFTSLPARGASIHPRGRDAPARSVLVTAGLVLGPQHLGLAATVGAVRLAVGRRPKVTLLTSGDEIVPPTARPRQEQVRDGNGPMLEALVPFMGGEVVERSHVEDAPSAAVQSLSRAARRSDVVVTVGGISAGERDPFVAAMTELATGVQVRGAAIQPGGPISVWRMARRRGTGPSRPTVIVGLPGNPVSALVCAHLFLWPILARLSGTAYGPHDRWRPVVLGTDVQPNPRRAMYRPAMGSVEAPGVVDIAAWSGSGDLASTADTEGVVEVPASAQRLGAGAVLRFLPWAWPARCTGRGPQSRGRP